LVDTSDWPTLGEEAVAAVVVKKDPPVNVVAPNVESRDYNNKDKDKKPISSKVKGDSPSDSMLDKEKLAAGKTTTTSTTTTTLVEAGAEKEQLAKPVAVSAAKSPAPDATTAASAATTVATAKEVKHVPKPADDGTKRVAKSTKWARLDVEPPAAAAKSSTTSSSSQSRRRSPRRHRDDYYYEEYYEERPRRGASTRGSVPSSHRAPRTAGTATAAAAAAATTTSAKPARATTSRRDGYITRSNRPSYTESKTPGLNGNPQHMQKSSLDPHDAKKKPITLRPIAVVDPMPIVSGQNFFGTFYYGPVPFALDAIGNIKEQIKKQM